jgi:hypothetical protein
MIIRKTQLIQYSGDKAMAWMMSEMGFSPWLGLFFLFKSVQIAVDPTLPSALWVLWILAMGIRWLGCDVDHFYVVLMLKYI